MRAIGMEPTDEEVYNLVQEVDRSGTGCLNFNDFLALLAHIFQVNSMDKFRYIFTVRVIMKIFVY